VRYDVNSWSATELFRQTPLFDGHNDLAAALRGKFGYSVDGLSTVQDQLHTDVEKLRRGGLGAQFWSVWVPSHLVEEAAVVATLEQIDAVYRLVAQYPDVFGFARTAADVERVFASGRIASLMGVEGGHAIAESLGVLQMFARLGVRYMTLTHNDDTAWAASATGLRQTTGLNEMGKAIVAEMNRIGIIVDLSHTSESTQLDAFAATSAPVIFSHSSARAVTDHPRNVSDHVLSKVGANGGVVQVTFVPEFVSQRCLDWEAEMIAQRASLGLEEVRPPHRSVVSAQESQFPAAPKPGESAASTKLRNAAQPTIDSDTCASAALAAQIDRWLEANPSPQSTLRDVADHVDHVREVAGIAHVGIGGDFDGTPSVTVGLENVSMYPALFDELASRGWSRADAQKLAGENVLRVLREAEEAASGFIA